MWRWSNIRALVSAITVILFGAVVLLGTGATPASATVSNQPNVTSYNLCGGGSCGGTGIQKADEFVGIVFNRSPKPLWSGFQEVCNGSSYNELAAWYQYFGYSARFEVTIPSGCGGNGYGIAIFWLGGCYGGSSCVVSGSYSANDGQNRKWVCAKAAFPMYAACTTHMSTGANAAANRGQYATVSSLMYAAGFSTLFFAGDWNQTPWGHYDFYAWTESDTSETSPQPTHSVGKIDYIFALNQTRVAQADVTSTTYSDHKILTGYFN